MPETPEGMTLRDRHLKSLDVYLSLLTESASVLKLYFGLQTGAIVLFIRTLVDARMEKIALSALAISIILFAASALVSLSMLIGLLSMRGNMVGALVERVPDEPAFAAKVKQWQDKMGKQGKTMEWLFRLAILFAAIFVIAVLLKN
jgi:hypothetical protein